MAMHLGGIPSDDSPTILATGKTDVRFIFASFSAREQNGRDADYLEWHSLDHRPEQYRIDGIRHSIRLVSTPECRRERAFSEGTFDATDHVMTYFLTEQAAFDQFNALSVALSGERRPFRLPSVYAAYHRLAGKLAAKRAIAGADVIPWRPSLGVYLLVERGEQSPAELIDVEGVAGIWWHVGGPSPAQGFPDNSGMQLAYCFLDGDPIEVAKRMRERVAKRWQSGAVTPLLAAPFYTLVPFEWTRYLP